MENGFIKIHRSILNWEWYDDPNTMRVFIHLLLNAQWEDSRYHGYEVPKGSLIIGRKKLAEELEISERAVRTALNHLKSTNEVTIKVTNQFSIVTIVNWAKYQGCDDKNDQQNDQQNDQRVTSERPATDHIKEYKNIRSKEYNNKSVSKFTPPSIDEVRQYCNERKNNIDPENFIDFYQSKGWKVGNQPMKDWKACVRTWERKQKPKKAEGISGNYDFDALENELRNN